LIGDDVISFLFYANVKYIACLLFTSIFRESGNKIEGVLKLEIA
jgi:hypothetical protein